MSAPKTKPAPFFANAARARPFLVSGTFDAGAYHKHLKLSTPRPERHWLDPWQLLSLLASYFRPPGCANLGAALFVGFWFALLLTALGAQSAGSWSALLPLTAICTALATVLLLGVSVAGRRAEIAQDRAFAELVHSGSIVEGAVTRAELRIGQESHYSQREETQQDFQVVELVVEYQFPPQSGPRATHTERLDSRSLGFWPSTHNYPADQLEEYEQRWRKQYGSRVPPVGSPVYVLLHEREFQLL